MIVIIRDFVKGIRTGDIIGNDTCVWTLVVVRDNGAIGLLAACVVIVVPGIFAFGDVEVDWECGHASVIIKVLLIASEERGFASTTKAQDDNFILGYVLGLLAIERAAVHHVRKEGANDRLFMISEDNLYLLIAWTDCW